MNDLLNKLQQNQAGSIPERQAHEAKIRPYNVVPSTAFQEGRLF